MLGFKLESCAPELPAVFRTRSRKKSDDAEDRSDQQQSTAKTTASSEGWIEPTNGSLLRPNAGSTTRIKNGTLTTFSGVYDNAMDNVPQYFQEKYGQNAGSEETGSSQAGRTVATQTGSVKSRGSAASYVYLKAHNIFKGIFGTGMLHGRMTGYRESSDSDLSDSSQANRKQSEKGLGAGQNPVKLQSVVEDTTADENFNEPGVPDVNNYTVQVAVVHDERNTWDESSMDIPDDASTTRGSSRTSNHADTRHSERDSYESILDSEISDRDTGVSGSASRAAAEGSQQWSGVFETSLPRVDRARSATASSVASDRSSSPRSSRGNSFSPRVEESNSERDSSRPASHSESIAPTESGFPDLPSLDPGDRGSGSSTPPLDPEEQAGWDAWESDPDATPSTSTAPSNRSPRTSRRSSKRVSSFATIPEEAFDQALQELDRAIPDLDGSDTDREEPGRGGPDSDAGDTDSTGGYDYDYPPNRSHLLRRNQRRDDDEVLRQSLA